MNLFDIFISLETNEEVHLGRILILLNEFSGKDGKGEIEGLTKLAKLDFLLRYPVYLERAIRSEGLNTKFMLIQEHERRSVESKMVRFKYGPWDFRYRKFINILVGKGLAYIHIQGRTIHLGLTEKGRATALDILNKENYSDIAERAKIVKRNFNFSATNLMRFIYKTFPEIISLQYGQEIK